MKTWNHMMFLCVFLSTCQFIADVIGWYLNAPLRSHAGSTLESLALTLAWIYIYMLERKLEK